MKGDPLEKEDLEAAGLLLAYKVVILAKPSGLLRLVVPPDKNSFDYF